MKIKLDENLPHELAAMLNNLGHDAQTVYGEKLSGSSDSVIWDIAQKEDRFLVTQDLDFSDVRSFWPGTHKGILLVRLREPSRTNLLARVETIFLREPVDRWTGCFVVATERKVRVTKK